jgi:hypothetical protein
MDSKASGVRKRRMDIGVSEVTPRSEEKQIKTTPDNQSIGVRVRFTAPVREKVKERKGERKETPRQYKQECIRIEKKIQGRLRGSSVAHRPQAGLVEWRAKLRNHPCGLRPHEILTGLLG